MPQWGGILVAGGGSTEVAAGGKGRSRLRMMVPSQVVRGDRYPGGCREEEGGIQVAIRMAVSRSPQNGGLRIAAEWRSPGRRRMEVSRSPQDGGLQVAAGWRSPGRRMMEVSRSTQNGVLQVAAKWRSPGRRRMEVFRSPHVCRSLWEGGGFWSHRVVVFKSPLGRGLHRVIFRLPRCEGLMSPKV